jgi:ribosome maturation protein SDO1
LVAEKCVDPNTGRPVSVGMVEKGMTEVGFNVRADKSAKIQVCLSYFSIVHTLHGCLTLLLSRLSNQALEAIKILTSSSSLSIQRARMRVRLTMPTKDGKRLKEKILAMAEIVEEDDMGSSEWEVVS